MQPLVHRCRRRILVVPLDVISMIPRSKPSWVTGEPRPVRGERHVEPPQMRSRPSVAPGGKIPAMQWPGFGVHLACNSTSSTLFCNSRAVSASTKSLWHERLSGVRSHCFLRLRRQLVNLLGTQHAALFENLLLLGGQRRGNFGPVPGKSVRPCRRRTRRSPC